MRITILYDNNAAVKGVLPAWGFAALIKGWGRTILFDAGGKPEVLLANMKALNISPKSVSDVFISHNHWDHAGGLFSFLNRNHRVKVFLPASFSDTYHNELKASRARPIRIDRFARIAKGCYSTGSLGEGIIEQALIIDAPPGLVVITGCAHPGIIKMVGSARKSLGKPVHAVLGGFHLAGKSAAEVKGIISEFKQDGVACAAPCHCTGKKAIGLFQQAYQKGFISAGAGSIIKL